MNKARGEFMKALDQLEEQINHGFFLSFINKIVVDEKKIFTIINELRSLVSEHFSHPAGSRDAGGHEPMQDPAPPVPAASFAEEDPVDDAAARDILDQARGRTEQMRRNADGLLADIEDRLGAALESVRKGRRAIAVQENSSGGEDHGSSQI
jgi:hypothetical protein